MLQRRPEAAEARDSSARVAALRAELGKDGLDGSLVPRTDEHQGEVVPACAARLQWLTGFSGSAGTAAVLKTKAALFVDGRYVVQARQQTDPELFAIQQVPDMRLSAWLAAELPRGARVGYDPRLHTVNEIEGLEKTLGRKGIALEPVAANLVDRVWPDRPAPPRGLVTLQPLELAGQSAQDKIAELQSLLGKDDEDAAVLTAPDSIAWLLNIRGDDVPHTPYALSFAMVPRSGTPALFIDPGKIGDNVRGALSAVADLRPLEALGPSLDDLGQAKARVRLDPDSAAKWFADRLTAAGAAVSRGQDLCLLPKARKNAAEIAGARAAHARDAVAMGKFLAWFDRVAPAEELDEIAVAAKLEAFRRATGALLDLSFTTISASGPNAALPHYHATADSNRRIEKGSVFLIDSGGQYRDGTTDITRTIGVGEVPREAKERFTLVLKGMIAVSVARFPKGTRGADLDVLARSALWERGLDYDHGTGHGVGSYLSVHEGPQRIAKSGSAALEPGMIVSNEPGLYKPGAYGIRIENLVVVTPPETPEGGERGMMGFETLSFAPIDTRMIVPELMTKPEIAWLDAYHTQVAALIGPHLAPEERIWLKIATKRLKR